MLRAFGALRRAGSLHARATVARGPTPLAVARAMSAAPHPSESFMTGTNSVYIEQMFEQWQRDPNSVHKSWDAFFRNVEKGAAPGQAFTPPPSLQPGAVSAAAYVPAAGVTGAEDDRKSRFVSLVRAYQVRGHRLSNLDPLGLTKRPTFPELDFRTYGFTEADLDQPLGFNSNTFSGIDGFLGGISPGATLREVLSNLEATYCSSMGIEYMHIQSRDVCNWLRKRIEVAPEQRKVSKEEKVKILDRLTFSDTFESFVSNKYSTHKRFGLEGAEALVPGMKALIDRSTELGVQSVVMGMAHRGRLNVLANVIRKPLEMIFKEFQGAGELTDEERLGDWSMSGDVKYHLGTSYDRKYPDGRQVHLSLVANPSHLEAVNPVVAGKTRAKQYFDGDEARERSMAVLLHGDAAFAGQGVVWETLLLSNLRNYTVGGTVHVVINNQIGFTTDPWDSRSTLYCTDAGKALEIPIFHVSADDPEAVARVFQLAAEWRAQFKRDCIVDLIGYRRHGHNELDQPALTQPVMYDVIKRHKPALHLYQERLVREGSMSQEEVATVAQRVHDVFAEKFEASKTYRARAEWLDSKWKGFKGPAQLSRIRDTGVDTAQLRRLGEALSTLPDGFRAHKNIAKMLQAKRESIQEGQALDWATAEGLAFATLLLEDNHVRLSGQDVERGTFSHRHAVIHDQATGERYEPLNNLARLGVASKQARFVAANSPLSEFGVLGFELGYSLENPNQLVLWEAQFGDFVNGAQVIIDQFLSSGEDKWLRQSGLVMLLPHGYDGQGAEHSSCRLERFLQMSSEGEDAVPTTEHELNHQLQRSNWQIVNASTPANYFHALRRQLHRDFRKPLIIPSPKNLLRLRAAASSLDEMGPGTKFQSSIAEVEPQALEAPERVRKLLLCSGKLYYELLQARREQDVKDIAIVRVEQLTPFPFHEVAQHVAHYPNASVAWCQEEPRNMGAWSHVWPRIEAATRKLNKHAVRPQYVGRQASASPATGYGNVHKREQDYILQHALSKHA